MHDLDARIAMIDHTLESYESADERGRADYVSPCSYYNGQSESLSTEAMTTVMCMRRAYGSAYVPWTILSYETL